MVRSGRGRGYAISLALDASQNRALFRGGMPRLWQDLIKNAKRGRKDVLSLQSRMGDWITTTLEASGLRLAPRWKVVLYVVCYALLAGPIAYLVFRRRRRPEYAWVAFTALAVGATVGVHQFGIAGRGAGVICRARGIIEVGADGLTARRRVYLGTWAPRRRVVAVRAIDPDTSVSAYRLSRPWQTAPTLVSESELWVEQAEAMRTRGMELLPGELRILQAEGPLRLPGPLKAELTRRHAAFHGTVTNGTGLRLENCWLGTFDETEQRLYRLGTFTLQKESQGVQTFALPNGEVLLDPGSPAPWCYDADLLLHEVFGEWSGGGRWGRRQPGGLLPPQKGPGWGPRGDLLPPANRPAYLMARVAADSGLFVNERPLEGKFLLMAAVSYRIPAGQTVSLPPSSIEVGQTQNCEVKADSRNRLYVTSTALNCAFELRPVWPAVPADAEPSEVALALEGECNVGAKGSVEIWNRAAKRWDRVGEITAINRRPWQFTSGLPHNAARCLRSPEPGAGLRLRMAVASLTGSAPYLAVTTVELRVTSRKPMLIDHF